MVCPPAGGAVGAEGHSPRVGLRCHAAPASPRICSAVRAAGLPPRRPQRLPCTPPPSALADFILASYFPAQMRQGRKTSLQSPAAATSAPSPGQGPRPLHPSCWDLGAPGQGQPLPTAQRPCPINAPSLLHRQFPFSSAPLPFLHNMLLKNPYLPPLILADCRPRLCTPIAPPQRPPCL